MKNILAEIKYFGKEYFRIPVRDFRTGISNLWRWLPIIWKDRDWDKHYIMEIFIFKLKRNRDYMINHGHTVNDRAIATMTECIDLLEKVHNEWDNYEEHSHDKHEEKWGKSEYYTEPCEDRPGSYSLKDRREDRMSPEDIEQMKKEFIIACKISSQKRKTDFKHALEIILEEFDGWWD
jgi:hypothetical protein